MTPRNLFIATLCIAALPLTALAERGGNGNGNGKGRENANRGNASAERGSARTERGNSRTERGNSANAQANRDARRGDGTLNPANGNSANARANPSQGFCPVGLRKRETGCVPPGQAANGTTATEIAEQRGYRYYAGAELSDDEYQLLPNYADYGLPDLPAGESYAVINRTAVVIDPVTNTLLRVATR